MAVLCTGRHIECRISIKEPGGSQSETHIDHRHHRPIFQTRNMVVAHRIPHHHIGVLNGAVGLGPFGQAIVPWVLVRVIPRWEFLSSFIRRHPQMFGHVSCPFRNTGSGMRKGQDVLSGLELVSHRFSHPILFFRVDNFPIASRERIYDLLPFLLVAQKGFLCVKRIPIGILRPHGFGLRMNFTDGIVVAVDHHVQPDT